MAARPIRFDHFMRDALYDPEVGYYTHHIRRVGRGGDFSTSATLGRELGRAIAEWARQARDGLGPGRRWHLIELGGGTGELAAQVLDSLGWWRRLFVTCHIVEISPTLRALQEERLAGRRVRWHATVEDALAATGGRRAVLFANEFVDAFPCRILRLSGERREELWLEEVEPKVWREAFRSAEDLQPGQFSSLEMEYPHEQRIEIQPDYRAWFDGLDGAVDAAALLVIDYGDTADALYDRRQAGTIRAYCQQTRLTGDEVYRRVGRQDLTVDVNFTDLQLWAREAGWRVSGYGTQAEFLEHRLGAAAQQGDADRFLRDEDGAGTAFKVLDLRKVQAG